MLISSGCHWASMKTGGCKFGGSKTGAVNGQKRGGGAVVSQLVAKLKESVPPPPREANLQYITVKNLTSKYAGE